eukprot:CAMPEP_0180173338 /NCGR_PEP_ID=MMETSP0986-20121125/35525_1 /TAXON_ID=697907 /ORGANISM="non described non described, Strain CCMP2293" /LENGTH=347 /DNA_ID=CAMNT_0022125525 /DNA_START=25 /DNA_END=1068 /DNA_ORIENTATION=-
MRILLFAAMIMALPLTSAFAPAVPAFSASRSPLRCAPATTSLKFATARGAARLAPVYMVAGESPAAGLRAKLATKQILTMPCCFDALSAKLVERAGFDITFMSGFSTSAAKLALPDTGLMSYGEMLDAGRDICAAVSIPVLGDGDTGYGNAMNVKRTVRGYAQAGFAAIMIEDQVAPKRCGHTKGKSVVGRDEAIGRVRAAVDARNEGADILILARTDSREGLGLEEALERIRLFAEAGADIVFMEAPQSIEEMRAACQAAPNTPHLANMLEGGKTPILPPAQLQELGFGIAAYPLTLLSASISAMNTALDDLKAGRDASNILEFSELRDIVGFNDYYAEEERYKQE